jgi:hypothetical protein
VRTVESIASTISPFSDQFVRGEREEQQAPGRPTDEMMADARRRATAPRSITAWLAGDPAPGRSALDKRRQVA